MGFHITYPLFVSDFYITLLISSAGFQKILKMSNLMKIHPVGAKLFHVDRQT
jgi:hypothetical protein